jgi:hypothetical protein
MTKKLRHAIYFFPDAQVPAEFVAVCICGWTAEKPTLFKVQREAIAHHPDAAVAAIKRNFTTTTTKEPAS